MTELGKSQRVRGDFRFSDDWITMPLQASTHWDALSHVILDNEFYNGFSASKHITSSGANRCAISAAQRGVVGRGVLIDVAHHRRVGYLPAGDVIEPRELDEVLAAQGVSVQAGDIVLIRTGWWRTFSVEGDRSKYFSAQPGPGMECAEWFRRHDVAAVCADNWGVEAVMSLENGWASPELPAQVFVLHALLVKYLGVMLGEIFDLERLSQSCAADGLYEFFFTAPPLPVKGGVGSPINPLVIK
jgi:kynurenine formamidase